MTRDHRRTYKESYEISNQLSSSTFAYWSAFAHFHVLCMWVRTDLHKGESHPCNEKEKTHQFFPSKEGNDLIHQALRDIILVMFMNFAINDFM